MSTRRKILLKKPRAKSVFLRLKEALEKELCFTRWEDSWQKDMVRFFCEFGEESGYHVRPEYLRIDCLWLVRLPNLSMIELAMENEEGNIRAVLDEVDKLGFIKAFLKVVICFNKESHLKRISRRIANQKIKIPEEEWFIINFNNSSEGIVTVSGYKFDANGEFGLIGRQDFNEDDIFCFGEFDETDIGCAECDISNECKKIMHE